MEKKSYCNNYDSHSLHDFLLLQNSLTFTRDMQFFMLCNSFMSISNHTILCYLLSYILRHAFVKEI